MKHGKQLDTHVVAWPSGLIIDQLPANAADAVSGAEARLSRMFSEPTTPVEATSKLLNTRRFVEWYLRKLGIRVATEGSPHAETIDAALAQFRKGPESR